MNDDDDPTITYPFTLTKTIKPSHYVHLITPIYACVSVCLFFCLSVCFSVSLQLRAVYDQLARDPNSLANLDQVHHTTPHHTTPHHTTPHPSLLSPSLLP